MRTDWFVSTRNEGQHHVALSLCYHNITFKLSDILLVRLRSLEYSWWCSDNRALCHRNMKLITSIFCNTNMWQILIDDPLRVYKNMYRPDAAYSRGNEYIVVSDLCATDMQTTCHISSIHCMSL